MIPEGYKHTELGILPEDWEVVRLGEACETLAGGDVPKDAFSKIKTGEYQIPILSNGIGEKALYGFTNQARIKKPCITISARGTIGYCSLQTTPFYPIVRLIVVLPKAELDPRFLYYSTWFLDIEGTKSGIPQLTIPMVEKIQIPLPPLSEQEKIAEILSTWDTQIQNLQSLITEKQNLKKGLCQTLLTAKTRLNGFSEDWQVVRLGELAEIKTGDSNREDSTENSGAYTFFDRSQDIRTSNRYLFDCEAIIVGGEGSDFVPKYFEGKFDLHQRSYAITKAKLNIKYLYYFITQYRNFFLKMAVGSTVKSLRMSCFTEFPVLLPPLSEQEKIAEILSETDNEITLLEQKLVSLESQKKGLMQILLNGKVRTRI